MWTVHTAHKVLSGNQLQLEIWLGRLLTKIHTEDLAVKLKGEILSLHSPNPTRPSWPITMSTIESKIRVENCSNSVDVLISIYIFRILDIYLCHCCVVEFKYLCHPILCEHLDNDKATPRHHTVDLVLNILLEMTTLRQRGNKDPVTMLSWVRAT